MGQGSSKTRRLSKPYEGCQSLSPARSAISVSDAAGYGGNEAGQCVFLLALFFRGDDGWSTSCSGWKFRDRMLEGENKGVRDGGSSTVGKYSAALLWRLGGDHTRSGTE